MVGHLTLNQTIGVRIPVPQPERGGHVGRLSFFVPPALLRLRRAANGRMMSLSWVTRSTHLGGKR